MTQLTDFLCLVCDTTWGPPQHISCPNCGPNAPTQTPQHVWHVGRLPHTQIHISGHLRDQERLNHLTLEFGINHIIDLADDPDQLIVWRPSHDEVTTRVKLQTEYRVSWYPVWNVKDRLDGVGLDPGALTTFCTLLDQAHENEKVTLVHCAAGLRRAPHFLYAWLRARSYTPGNAWANVRVARPRALQDPVYIQSVEAWLVDRKRT